MKSVPYIVSIITFRLVDTEVLGITSIVCVSISLCRLEVFGCQFLTPACLQTIYQVLYFENPLNLFCFFLLRFTEQHKPWTVSYLFLYVCYTSVCAAPGVSVRCVQASSILTSGRCLKSMHTTSQRWQRSSNVLFHSISLDSKR